MTEVPILVLLAWPFVVLALLSALGPKRGAPLAYIIGWLFLPLGALDIPGLPPYSKFTATSLALAILIPLTDSSSLARLRWRWLDLPMLVWCLCPIASSVANGLGLYDGFSGALEHALAWGAPHIVGRLYITTSKDFSHLGKVLVTCALLYFPLALFEARMSPQLHRIVYGAHGRPSWEVHSDSVLIYSPTVFMNSAFELSALFGFACLIAFHRWRTRATRIGVIGNGWAACILGFAVLVEHKWSGIGITSLGLVSLCAIQAGARRLVIPGLAAIPLVYMGLFASGVWQGEGLPELASRSSDRRAQSLETRLINDRILIHTAMERPVLGWGGYGRNRVTMEGEKVATTDTLWMIVLGTRGMVGLISLVLLLLLPPITFSRRAAKMGPHVAPVTPFLLVTSLQLIDMLFNGFPNFLYPMCAGGIVSAIATLRAMGRLQRA